MQRALRAEAHESLERLDGYLALTTPEGVRLRVAPAGPRPRAVAWLVDSLIQFLVLVLTNIVLMAALSDKEVAGAVGLLFLFTLWWGYPILFEQFRGGRTPGKKAAGLVVIRQDGLPVGWRDSIIRNLLLVADFLPFLYTTGLLCMLCDARFRRVGDIVAGTLVVYHEPPPKRALPPAAEPAPLPFALQPEQQRLLISLFEREQQLPPARVQELATLAEPLTGSTGPASLERLRSYVAGLLQ